MRDNKTSQKAVEYDANVSKTLPMYQFFHQETLNLIEFGKNKVESWLDTGSGTGTLILKAIEHFGDLRFVIADPSEAMLDVAKEKFSGKDVTYLLAGSEDLPEDILDTESFDVVTAIMAHHYLDSEARRKATQNCFRVLKKGGIYVTFETIRPNTEQGTQIGLQRWKESQIKAGKSVDSADKHISRYGTDLMPISIEAHVNLLKEVGFSTVEILWASGMQAGFYAIK